jgi:hypothetical protein
MDFSLNVVDPSLQSTTSTSSASSSLDFLAGHDFDLFTEGLFTPVASPSMVLQTIEPFQLTDNFTPSPSPYSSPTWASYSSDSTSPSYFSDISGASPPQPRRNNKNTKSQFVTRRHSHSHEPYDTEHHSKRHQTKLACTWCRKLSKKCDAQRPCGRCVQFNRCSECVDAPPRKPRAKGVDRGTYKKTRDLATIDYQEAVSRREAYVAKRGKMGATVKVGLTADEILEKARKDEAKIEKEIRKEQDINGVFPPFKGDVTATIQGGSLPFTGPLEDLFTCSAFPEIEELLFSSPPSPATSLFDVSSPTDTSSSVTDHDELDQSSSSSSVDSWHWQTFETFPNLMELVAAAQANEAERNLFDPEEFQRLSDLALVA